MFYLVGSAVALSSPIIAPASPATTPPPQQRACVNAQTHFSKHTISRRIMTRLPQVNRTEQLALAPSYFGKNVKEHVLAELKKKVRRTGSAALHSKLCNASVC
jgi:hypothetical protein